MLKAYSELKTMVAIHKRKQKKQRLLNPKQTNNKVEPTSLIPDKIITTLEKITAKTKNIKVILTVVKIVECVLT